MSQWIITIVAIAVVLLTIIVVAFYLQSEKRKRIQREKDLQLKLEAERREREISEEKLRISRELHDNIGSQITFMISSMDNMKYGIEAPNIVQKLDQLSGFGRDAISDLRHAIWALKSDTKISEIVLKVRQMVQRLSGGISAKITIEADIKDDLTLNSIEAINLLRIIQEAVQNATKYANATQIIIELYSSLVEIKLRIRDDGKGFVLEDAEKKGGEGLANLRARAKAMGGELSINSVLEKGSEILFNKKMRE